jgi:hypothetical protein
MKAQAAEQSLLGVWHATAQVLDFPDAKLHDAAAELRADAVAVLTSLADHMRQPNLDVRAAAADLKDGIVDLMAKAVEIGENPDNEIDFSVKSAKEKIAVVLDYYAERLQNGGEIKKALTHPTVRGFAKAVLDAVGVGSKG